MELVIMLLIIWAFTLILLAFMLFMVFKGVGFNMFVTHFKARMRKKKGFGLARIYFYSGFSKYFLINITRATTEIKTSKDKTGLYNIKAECLNFTETEIPEIMYSPGEADPFNPRLGLPTVTDPEVQQSTLSKLNTAQNVASGGWDWLAKNWGKLAIFFCVIVGLFVFGYIHAIDQITLISQQVGKSVIIGNISGLGK